MGWTELAILKLSNHGVVSSGQAWPQGHHAMFFLLSPGSTAISAACVAAIIPYVKRFRIHSPARNGFVETLGRKELSDKAHLAHLSISWEEQAWCGQIPGGLVDEVILVQTTHPEVHVSVVTVSSSHSRGRHVKPPAPSSHVFLVSLIVAGWHPLFWWFNPVFHQFPFPVSKFAF